MANKKKTNLSKTDVDAFIEQLNHPFKTEINRLRFAIKEIDQAIIEEIKWNAPSFKIEDHFATFKLYPSKSLQIVLHTGAKPEIPQRVFTLDDPHKLLKWPAINRCVITLNSPSQAAELNEVVVDMAREWVRQLSN